MSVIEIPEEQWAQVLEKPGGSMFLLFYLKLDMLDIDIS
jgi:hypothetical protein